VLGECAFPNFQLVVAKLAALRWIFDPSLSVDGINLHSSAAAAFGLIGRRRNVDDTRVARAFADGSFNDIGHSRCVAAGWAVALVGEHSAGTFCWLCWFGSPTSSDHLPVFTSVCWEAAAYHRLLWRRVKSCDVDRMSGQAAREHVGTAIQRHELAPFKASGPDQLAEVSAAIRLAAATTFPC